MVDNFTRDLVDENATLQFGHAFAQAVVPGIHVFLQGNLGAGKTTLVRGFLAGLGYRGRVKSPTYTLLESYEISRENGLIFTVNHFDLYRFTDEDEWESAGFREAFNAQSVCLIEWPEKAIETLPKPDIEIALSMKNLPEKLEVGRLAAVQGFTDVGKKVCAAWLDVLQKGCV
jgi:tRNA threonylcarbamoyladenosine biosynthesis protein TsaE